MISFDSDNTSNNPSIYVNGTLVSLTQTGSQSGAIVSDASADMHIGGEAGAYTFDGSISNLALHQTILDAQTISQMAKSRFTPMRDNRFSVVDFDGSNDYIDCGNDSSLELAGDITITAWINPTGADSSQGIVTKRDGGGTNYYFALDSSTPPKLTLYDGSGSGTSTGTITKDSWQHIAISIDSGVTNGSIFYINGIASGTATLTITANDAPLVIGRRLSDNYYEGSISSASVYNTAKSAEEVYALYSKGITYNESSESGLVGLWRMGDDTSKAYPTIADSSSNSNDGTASGAVEAQQMVAGYDMGAFESTGEELGGELFNDPSFELSGNNADGEDTSYFSSVPSGVQFTNGQMIVTGSGNKVPRPSPNPFLEGGKTYKIVINTASYTSGKIRFGDSDYSPTTGYLIPSSIGDNVFYYSPTGDVYFSRMGIANAGSGTVFTLNSITIKEVLQSDLSDTYPFIADVNEPVLGVDQVTNGTFDTDANWSKGTGWSINTSTKKAECNGTQTGNTELKQQDGVSGDVDFVVGKTYKVTFDVTVTAGAITYIEVGGGTDHNDVSETQDNVIRYITATSTNDRLTIAGNSTFEGTVDNVVVKEVQGNVGTMTQMLSSNLVYSSVLPDQSFLTGVNSAYNFIDLDGADQYIDCGDGTSLDTTSQLTLSSWVNFDSTGTNVILARDDNTNSNYILYGWSDGKIYAQIQISGVGKTVDGGSYSSDTWYHVVVTFDGSSLKIYVDADLKDTLSASGSIDNDDVSLEIGRKGNNAFHFDGQIGQTAIYNKALSATEVGAIYNLGRHGNLLDSYSDNLVGNWAMSSLDSATGLSDSISTVYDKSGNSNHGTPTNADAGDLASSPNAEPNGYAKGDTNRSTTTP